MFLYKGGSVSFLDIGSSKISCILVQFDGDQKPRILGYNCCASHGIVSGIITDLYLLQSAISECVSVVENQSARKINKVHLSISNALLQSRYITTKPHILNKEVRVRDVYAIVTDALGEYSKDYSKVIHSFILDYIVDGYKGISNPLGMHCTSLSCKMHTLTVSQNFLLNVNNCLNNLNIKIESYMSSTYCSALACLSKTEMEVGTIFVEFSGGYTSVSSFEKMQMTFCDTVLLGGINVTNDIAQGLAVTFADAERLKSLYGAVVEANADKYEQINISSMSTTGSSYRREGNNMITRALLIQIIKARMEEIVMLLLKKLQNVKTDKMSRVVITGGVANTAGIKELVEKSLARTVRVCLKPQFDCGNDLDEIDNYNYITVVGMMLHLYKNMEQSSQSQFSSRSVLSRYMVDNWVKGDGIMRNIMQKLYDLLYKI